MNQEIKIISGLINSPNVNVPRVEKMKIGITTFGCDLKSGMSRYVTSLITQFADFEGTDQFEVIAHESALHEYLSGVKNNNIPTLHVDERLQNPLLNVAWHQLSLPGVCKKQGYDVLFLPAASRRMPVWSPCPAIGTIHDMSPFHITGKYDHLRNLYQMKVLPKMFERLTHVISISESTKADILKFTNIREEDITVIHHAADTRVFYPRDKEQALASLSNYRIKSPYIIYISRIESPGKNHLNLIHAFEKLKRDEDIPHQLVLAGADWHGAEDVHLAAEKSQFSQDILLTGFVGSEDLPNLYSAADLMVFPSLFEGFGLPILEAMSCGVPVACSDISSMPEIAGEGAVLFDPHNVESMSKAMFKILSSNENKQIYSDKGLERAAQFSWQETARETLDVMRRFQ